MIEVIAWQIEEDWKIASGLQRRKREGDREREQYQPELYGAEIERKGKIRGEVDNKRKMKEQEMSTIARFHQNKKEICIRSK